MTHPLLLALVVAFYALPPVLASQPLTTSKTVTGDTRNATRVLFVGNSFTFVNDLPSQLVNIATSLGEKVEVANSTIGGCTLYHQTPEHDRRTATLLQQEWDYIVLQDYSALPTVRRARSEYLNPAISNFTKFKKDARIALYLTWGYHDGMDTKCPSSDTDVCFPLGTLKDLTNPSCKGSQDYQNKTGTFDCMSYAVARGYLDAKNQQPGVDLVVPCGVTWQTVRASKTVPAECKSAVDNEYSSPLSGLSLPVQVPDAQLPELMLYRILSNGVIDKHPNVAGQYLNALVFFTSIFGRSPVGAAAPLPTDPDTPLTDAQLLALQTAAETVVLKYRGVWGVA